MNKFKKVLTGVSALALAIALLPVFSAFEAHVINVTAKIENALSVPTESLNFGTVFPQEQLEKTLNISLSQSFLDETNADDVEYIIRQKPKCAVTSDNGTTLVGPTWTGHVVPVGPNSNEYTVDCVADAPADLATILQNNPGASAGLLPSLCEYVSKHPDGTPTNDGSLNSFHKPFTVSNGVITWNDVRGRLAKSDQDPADSWTIDLAVPCFGNFCAQDWANYVHTINPGVPTSEAGQWTQDIANEHKIFGCNLWVEVTGVSRVGEVVRPEVGANLTTYAAPAQGSCDVTVDDNGSAPNTITAGIAQAQSGGQDTVCVAPGVYNETVDIELVSLTLVSTGGSGVTTINGGIIVDADNVMVKGFEITGGNTEGTFAGFYIKSGADNTTIRDNELDGPAVNDVSGSRGIVNVENVPVSNILVENNFIHEWTSGIYTSPHVGGGTLYTIRLNDIDDNLAGIGDLNSALVEKNEFQNSGVSQEAIGAGPDYDLGIPAIVQQNNFLNGTMLNTYVAITGPDVDADNNFWNLGGAVQTGGTDEIDFTPEEVSAFPHN